MRTAICLLLIALLAAPAISQNPLTQVGFYGGEGYHHFFGSGMTTGDFDNDSYMEFIIGAYGWNNNTGKNYIYPGGPEFPTEPAWLIHGQEENDGYDISNQNVGDVSGDGIDDFAIPSIIYGAQDDTSRLDLFFGSEPFDTIPDWTFTPPYFEWYNAWSIDSCGDVNGDGGKDFIIRVRCIPYDTSYVFIFWGGQFLDTIPDWIYPETSLGLQVNGLGDVNGDGYGDVLFRGYTDDPSLIFFGGSPMDTIPDVVFDDGYAAQGRGAGVGDINGDGYNDVVLTWFFPDSATIYDVVHFGGPDMDTIPDCWLRKWNGGFSASLSWEISSGDFNGDGYSDIVTMAGYGFYQDAVQIHLGSPDMNAIPDAYLLGSPLDGWGDYLDAGDINGDGRYELLVCAMDPTWEWGEVYLYEGPETWIDYGAVTVPGEDLKHHPGWFTLDQNYPNPFNASTTIHFEIGKPSVVNMTIYDLQGNKIKDLIAGEEMLPGGYNVSWTGRDEYNQPVSSGIYLLELQVDQYREIRKMVLLR